MPGLQSIVIAIAALTAGAVSASVLMAVFAAEPVSVYVAPDRASYALNQPFTVSINVRSDEPVNVFKGTLRFDHTRLHVERIDYNTSIADLWAEEPWYENGDGTLSFIGGTTRSGGFTGDETLITITFSGISVGTSALHLTDLRVLRHDGLGTDAIVAAPIDALFTVPEPALAQETIATPKAAQRNIAVLAAEKTTDLNGDGQQTIADLSIFMRDLTRQNPRSDFNGDGYVSTADLSILLLR